MNSALQRMLRPAGRENNWRSPSVVFPGPFVLPSLNKLMSRVAAGLFGVRQEFVTVIRQSRREQNRDLGNFTKCLQIMEIDVTTSQVQTPQSNSLRGLPLADEGN
jgi:hypothetical protein